MTPIPIPSRSECATFTVNKHQKSGLITSKYDLPPLTLLTCQKAVSEEFEAGHRARLFRFKGFDVRELNELIEGLEGEDLPASGQEELPHVLAPDPKTAACNAGDD